MQQDRLALYFEAGQEVTACWKPGGAMLRPAPTQFRECPERDETPANWLDAPQTRSLPWQRKQEKGFIKTERPMPECL